MYRFKLYESDGNYRFRERGFTKLSDAVRIAQLKLRLFPEDYNKIDIYKDDKLIATVYG